ncbi:uncharacterized protein LOC106646755 [Copidosoma floridanum]|uniref:uncharacterized protein LOC106646755 n=1 Tax=Copidosoma floridanum TaxID=29053 RepID=UPI000C6FB4D9|nr:uncharacterized protein LOC106646755 [Copidosoma floridanum]
MHTSPEAFTLASSIGLWEPVHWNSRLVKNVYKIYSCFTFSVITWFLVIQMAATIIIVKTVDDFVESTYMLLSTINAFVKGATIILRKKHVLNLIRMLQQEMCLPSSLGEKILCTSYDKISRYTVISTIILAESTVWCLSAWPFLLARDQHILPIMAYYPFGVESGWKYWLSYLHQAISLGLVAAYDVANDNIITGFMIQACAQLELMTYRLNKLSRRTPVLRETSQVTRIIEKNIITQSVRHHLLIFKLADDINSIFAPVIGVQFCLSSIVMCTTIYLLSFKDNNGIELIFLIMYLISMIVEFFMYCWFGNEVTEKSLEFSLSVSKMNWAELNTKSLQELLIMMIRSTSPILLSCGPLITLSLESFMKMIKLSYSAFSVLQRLMSLLILSELIALVLLTENIDDFAEASYVFLASFNGCVKGVTFLWRRKRIDELANVLVEKEFTPKNMEERRLCSYYDKMSRLTRFPELIGETDSWEKARRIEKLLLAQSVNHHVNIYDLGLSQLAQIVFVRHDFKSFNDTFFILLSTNLTCFKAIRILLNQKQVISLMEMFKQDCCLFHDCFEKNIEKRCEYYCRKVAISLLCLCEITGIFLVIAPLFKDTENQELPYKVLLPYDISNPLFYWLTFVHHAIDAAIFAAISIITDALIIGFMLHVCAQLDLLQFRLTRFPELIGETDSWEKARRIEKLLLAQSVNHHVNIYEISKSVCTVFSEIIISQFCVSAIEISISVYQLSLHMTNVVESCTYLLYLICMLGQLFVYCYFGNEVHLQSKKINYTIFSINYTPLSIELQKDLTLMNLLSSKPITISYGPFVRLILDSFTNIVRISYSTFNLLHNSV